MPQAHACSRAYTYRRTLTDTCVHAHTRVQRNTRHRQTDTDLCAHERAPVDDRTRVGTRPKCIREKCKTTRGLGGTLMCRVAIHLALVPGLLPRPSLTPLLCALVLPTHAEQLLSRYAVYARHVEPELSGSALERGPYCSDSACLLLRVEDRK